MAEQVLASLKKMAQLLFLPVKVTQDSKLPH